MRWFKHDSDAMLDAKLKRIRIKYGMEGYGLYWYCLELIAQTVEPHNLTFELEHDAEIIAHDTGIHYERVQEMMLYMVDLGLFENCNGAITCLKMAARTDEYTQKLLRSSNSIRINSGQTPDKIPPNRREKKRKEEIEDQKKGAKAPKKFIPPTVDEVREYCQQRQNNVDPESFIAHYEANGWYRGKSKIKDWKACVITWEKRNAENQQTNQQGRKLSLAERATEARKQFERDNPDA